MGLRGPKTWVPTEAELKKIELYAGLGATQEQIAKKLGRSVDSLDRHAREALDSGKMDANLKVAGVLFREAMKGNITAAIFWAKTQMGWNETQKHEHSGRDGKPIEYRDLSEDEIDARLRNLIEKHGPGEPSDLVH